MLRGVNKRKDSGQMARDLAYKQLTLINCGGVIVDETTHLTRPFCDDRQCTVRIQHKPASLRAPSCWTIKPITISLADADRNAASWYQGGCSSTLVQYENTNGLTWEGKHRHGDRRLEQGLC